MYKISLLLLSFPYAVFAMNEESLAQYNNPYKNPTTHEEIVGSTAHKINHLLEELTGKKKQNIPKYDAVKVLREWISEFSAELLERMHQKQNEEDVAILPRVNAKL